MARPGKGSERLLWWRRPFAQGFRGLDTAGQPKHYDEAGVGLGMAQALNSALSRQDIFLQSKFTPMDGQDPRRLPYDSKASLAEQVAQSFANSLRNLQTRLSG